MENIDQQIKNLKAEQEKLEQSSQEIKKQLTDDELIWYIKMAGR